MSKEIITIQLSNDLDIVLVIKYTIQLADFLGLSLSDHTQFATAISEICRNCLEYVGKASLTFGIVTEKNHNYLQVVITDSGKGIPPKEFEKILSGEKINKPGRGNGILYSRKLTDKFEIDTCSTGTCVKLSKLIPKEKSNITDLDIKFWQDNFENNKAVSPYEEIKKHNWQLLKLTEELNEKNVETQKQLEEIKRLNSDLTQSHERITEGNEIFKFITENIPQMIYRTDPHGNIQFMNSHFKDYLGLHIDVLPNKDFEKYIWPENFAMHKITWLNGLRTGKQFEFIQKILRFDGVYRWHKGYIKPIYDTGGKLLMWIGTSVDIDDQKKWSEELESTVLNRTQDLVMANSELNRSNQDLELYAYVASHDLKEPIRMVSNFTGLLAKKYHDKLDPEALEFISFIEEGAERMKFLINDLLKYSRVGRTETEKSLINCNEVLKIVLSNLEEKIDINGAQIHIKSEMPTLPGVKSMLIQLFQNLIDNALKFRSSETPEIHISAEKKRQTLLF